MTTKEKRFNEVLVAAKTALDNANIPFHLHAGTALGSHREKTFIKHDHDIDLGVFAKDVDTPEKYLRLIKAMKKEGFIVLSTFGKLKRGKEIQFEYNNIGLDIFWVYEGVYRDKKYFILSSYLGYCDDLKHKSCIWAYRPYSVVTTTFLGKKYKVVPKKTLVDMYGKDWKIPKKFSYDEGILHGGYKGFLKDYYDPKPTDNNIAFCFLLYDTVKHKTLWEKFFSSDKNPIPSYSIYTHLKSITDKTPKWISDNKIKNIKTGWCEENLVFAWIKLLKAAMKDTNNKYFVILSGECIPLFNFDTTYDKITKSKKSRIHIDYNAESYVNSGLYYADQWVILNRKHAQALIDLKETDNGKKFMKDIKKEMCPENEDICYCPDEIYPVNWFIHKYGAPSSLNFKKNFSQLVTTYTHWDDKSQKPHPQKFNSVTMGKMRKKICKSGAVFARKFNNKAARELGMDCEK